MFLVVDDHDMVLDGTLSRLQSRYPDTEIVTAQSADDALKHLQSAAPDLLLLDLSIPQTEGEEAQVDVGLQLLRSLMTDYPELNITVQSSYAKALVRVVHNIESHAGGFTVASKTLPAQEMLARVDWALQGLT
ncbi:MAG: response regulator, partial [Elainellaceae cyanobacterium]